MSSTARTGKSRLYALHSWVRGKRERRSLVGRRVGASISMRWEILRAQGKSGLGLGLRLTGSAAASAGATNRQSLTRELRATSYKLQAARYALEHGYLQQKPRFRRLLVVLWRLLVNNKKNLTQQRRAKPSIGQGPSSGPQYLPVRCRLGRDRGLGPYSGGNPSTPGCARSWSPSSRGTWRCRGASQYELRIICTATSLYPSQAIHPSFHPHQNCRP